MSTSHAKIDDSALIAGEVIITRCPSGSGGRKLESLPLEGDLRRSHKIGDRDDEPARLISVRTLDLSPERTRVDLHAPTVLRWGRSPEAAVDERVVNGVREP